MMRSKILKQCRFFYDNFKWVVVDVIIATVAMMLFFSIAHSNFWVIVFLSFLTNFAVSFRGYGHGVNNAYGKFNEDINAIEKLQEKVFLYSAFGASMDKYRIHSHDRSDIQ